MIDEKALAGYLNVTKQQFQIIKSIKMLKELGIKATPVAINKKYESLFNTRISKPNLFRQLKILSNEGILYKPKKSTYSFDIDGIRVLLDKKEEHLKTDMQHFSEFKNNVDGMFNLLSHKDDSTVKYLSSTKDFFHEVNKYLENADELFLTSPFCNITFTEMVSEISSRKKYNEILKRRCFIEKKLKIVYLTKLNLNVPYIHAYTLYGDKGSAKEETKIMIDRLVQQINSHKMIDAYYMENPLGFDFLMPIRKKDPRHVFLYIRNEQDVITGGIYIRSLEIGQNAIKHFFNELNSATDLTSPKGKKLIQKLYSKLNKK